MDDDRIVVEDDGTGGEGPPSRPAWWILALGLVVVTVIVLSSGPDEPDETQPTTTTVSVPTVEVPPTIPSGEIVEETIRWEDTAAPEDATHIGGAVAFDGGYWLIGRTETGLVAWRSDDPASGWTETAVLEEGVPGWLVEDVEMVDESLVVAASGWEWNNGGGAVYRSTDGREWTRHDLDTGRSDLPVAVGKDIIPVDDGVVITGHGHSREPPEADLGRLAPEVRDLVMRGRASLAEANGENRVMVPPGISVAQLPLAGQEDVNESATATPDATEPFLWWGDDLADLEAESRADMPIASSSARLPDGRLIGQTGDRLALSEDGRTWEPAGPSLASNSGFVPWNDVFVLAAAGEGPAYWTEGREEAVPLLPEELSDEPVPVSTTVAAGEWGLALTRQPRRFYSGPGPILVTRTENGDLYMPNPLTVELRRDGVTVWSQGIGQGRVEVEPDGRLRFGTGQDSIAVEVDDWLEALYFISGSGRPAATAKVVHTVEGEEWSSATWETISGLETVAELGLFGTDDFLLVADQAIFPIPRLNDVAVGLPLDRDGR